MRLLICCSVILGACTNPEQSTDAGAVDAGAVDAVDEGTRDAGTGDAGTGDTPRSDAGMDAGLTDGGMDASTRDAGRAVARTSSLPFLRRWQQDVAVLPSFVNNSSPFNAEPDSAFYAIVARSNVLLTNRRVALLTDSEAATVVDQVDRLARYLLEHELSVSTCGATFRQTNASYFPPLAQYPLHGWGFSSYDMVLARDAGAGLPPACMASPPFIKRVSEDDNVELMRFAYDNGHAILGLTRAAMVLEAYGRDGGPYADRAAAVMDDWFVRHSGTPNGLPGYFYEEFHPMSWPDAGAAPGSIRHARHYWAVNSNAVMAWATMDLARLRPSAAVAWLSFARRIAEVWKYDAVELISDGGYRWPFALSTRPMDTYVEDTTHAGVTMPFLSEAYLFDPVGQLAPDGGCAFSVCASDIAETAKSLEHVLKAAPLVHARMDGVGSVFLGEHVSGSDGGFDDAGFVRANQYLGEWAGLAPALRRDRPNEVEPWLVRIHHAMSDAPRGYYHLLFDSYAVRALAE